MLLTAQELADLICDADDCDTDARRIVLRRVRRFEAEKMIHAAPERRDDRGTLQFDESAACVARILSRLTDLGFDRQILSQVLHHIAPPASGTMIEGGIEREVWNDPDLEARHIKNLPAAIMAGRDRILRLFWQMQFGKLSVSGGIVAPHFAQSPDATEAGEAFRKNQNIQRIATLELSATELCRPVVEHYRQG